MAEYRNSDEALNELESRYKNLSKDQLAKEAVNIAVQQISACYEFKKPRLERINKYWELYDGKVPKKIRQLFNVPIPVFSGMVDTLNAQYDTPIRLDFKEGDASDHFKVEKINGAWSTDVLDTAENSKWDEKLTLARSHAIITGRPILEYTVHSDPHYHSELEVVNLQDFNFQPKGGMRLEDHLFAGTEDIEKTEAELLMGAGSGVYDKEQVKELIRLSAQRDYLPGDSHEQGERLSRFKALGLDPDNHSYVGQSVYKLASHILEIDGTRYYLCFHPWTKTWLRFEKWKDICSSDLYPWVTYATHPNDKNFLSKSFGDDLYAAADAIVAMFNQELTNREKRNFGARAYDKDMFKDVRKLDEAMHRPDALVPADTSQGTKRISEGVYEFKTAELQGTVNLIDWITGTLGRDTGATDLAQGSTQDVSKKASVTFAEQKAVSKRVSWRSKPFQTMMADLGKRYIYGLKDHMPSKMAIRVMGQSGWDWDEITKLDLKTKKDVDILIVSGDQEVEESELRAKRRAEALALVDPMTVNPQKRTEEILRSVGGYEDEEIAEFLDVKTYSDRRALAKAAESIQLILSDEEPEVWYGANIAFMQKILDFANDKRTTLGDKYQVLVDYMLKHKDIARENIQRQVFEDVRASQSMPMQQPMPDQTSENPGVPGGISKAMSIAENAV